MRVVLYEPERSVRTIVSDQLRDQGHTVASFGDSRVAFLFVLGRLRDLEGLIVNVDAAGRGRWLIERLELVRQPLAVVTYSEDDGANGAQIHQQLLADLGTPPGAPLA